MPIYGLRSAGPHAQVVPLGLAAVYRDPGENFHPGSWRSDRIPRNNQFTEIKFGREFRGGHLTHLIAGAVIVITTVVTASRVGIGLCDRRFEIQDQLPCKVYGAAVLLPIGKLFGLPFRESGHESGSFCLRR